MVVVLRPTRQTLALVYAAVITTATLLRLSSAYVNTVKELPMSAVTTQGGHYLVSRLNFTFDYPMFSGTTGAPGLRPSTPIVDGSGSTLFSPGQITYDPTYSVSVFNNNSAWAVFGFQGPLAVDAAWISKRQTDIGDLLQVEKSLYTPICMEFKRQWTLAGNTFKDTGSSYDISNLDANSPTLYWVKLDNSFNRATPEMLEYAKVEGFQKFYMAACGSKLSTQINDFPDGSTPLGLYMFSGKITMKNPTGYLDANLYGMIPFWGVMSFVYGALSTYFAFCWYKHRDQTIVMHYGIFAVLIISFTDAVSYFGTWSEGNGSGDKPCCPFATNYFFSLVLTVFRNALCRVFLLVVCLGLGVAKPELPRRTNILVTLLATLYIAFGVNEYIQESIYYNDVSADKNSLWVVMWSFPRVVCDGIFIGWIYIALDTTHELMGTSNEKAKEQLYKRVGISLIAYVVVSLVTAITDFSFRGSRTMMWKMQWVGWVISDVWVAVMLAYIIYLLLPDDNSSQYAYAMQLPQDDSEVGAGPPGGDDGDWNNATSGGGGRTAGSEVEEIEIELADVEADIVLEKLEETLKEDDRVDNKEKERTEQI